MTAAQFRGIALSLHDTSEGEHMSHADFRVRRKVFATLGWPDAGWGMVNLSPEAQAEFMRAHPAAFSPAKGAWGRKGSTRVCLGSVEEAVLCDAIAEAWSQVTSKHSSPAGTIIG